MLALMLASTFYNWTLLTHTVDVPTTVSIKHAATTPNPNPNPPPPKKARREQSNRRCVSPTTTTTRVRGRAQHIPYSVTYTPLKQTDTRMYLVFEGVCMWVREGWGGLWACCFASPATDAADIRAIRAMDLFTHMCVCVCGGHGI